MLRKIKILSFTLLALILLAVLSAILYIRSGGLDRFLQNQIIASLKDAGIRAEIGGTQLNLSGNRATLNNLRLYVDGENQPFAVVEKIEGDFSVISYLGQRINLKHLTITKPEMWIQVDEQGRSTFDKFKSSEGESAKDERFKIFTATFDVKEAAINLEDKKDNLSGRIENLSAHLEPRNASQAVDELNHTLNLSLDNSHLTYRNDKLENLSAQIIGSVTEKSADIESLKFNGKGEYQGHNIEKLLLEAKAKVTTDGAEITSLKFDSDIANLTTNGKLFSFKPLKYDFKDVQLNTALSEISRLFAPDLHLNGNAAFAGEITGEDDKWQARGSLQSASLNASGFTVTNVRVTNLEAQGKGAEYTAQANVSASQVKNKDFQINSLQLNNSNFKGKEAAFDATTQLTIAAFNSGKIDVTGVRGRLVADSSRVTLTQLAAQALGGSVNGSASISYKGNAPSKVDVNFNELDLQKATELAAAKDVTVQGKTSGAASLTFPGVNYQAATGKVDATFDAQVKPASEGAEPLPAKGTVNLLGTGHGFTIERAAVNSSQSEINATGTMTWDGLADLQVNFKSSDMSEVQRILDSFGIIPDDIKNQYEVALNDTGEFSGRVQGKLDTANVNGHLRVESVKLHDEVFGSVEGDVAYSPERIHIDNGVILRPDNSRADFTLTAALQGDKEVDVKANVKDFDLPQVVSLAVPGLEDKVIGGKVNGTVDLQHIGDMRKLTGTANLTLSAAEFKIPQEDEKESKPISVPEFVGNITFANSVLSVDNLRMKINDSVLTGTGTFNFDTYDYALNAEGKQIDLAQLSDAFASEDGGGTKLAGLADLKVNGQGKWGKDKSNDWSNVSLNATIQGQNVSINGRDVGNAAVVATTENGILNIKATGNILDKDRTLTATVDLRDRKNYPLNSTIEFEDAELGQYLGMVSPDLSSVNGRATGSIIISGPLLDTDKLQAQLTLSKLELGGNIGGSRAYRIKNEGNVVITATPKLVTVEPVTFTGEDTSITIAGTIGDESKPNLAVNGDLNLQFISSFDENVMPTGTAHLEASVTGTLKDPKILGLVKLQNVGVRVVDLPVSVARGYGQIRFTANQALVEDFTASTPGGGRVTIEGGAALSGFVPERFRLEAKAEQVGAEYPRDTSSVADANLTFQGNRKVQVLSGNVKVRRASYTKDITIEELVTTGGPFAPAFFETGPGGKGDPGPPINLDIHIEADNTIVVRNNLADAIGSASLNLRGPISEPIVSGRLQFNQGTIEFRNGRHEITRALITLPGRRGAEPIIDMQTEADISGYRIISQFTGVPSKLKTVLRADPDLPETDIISLLLTGSVSGDTRSAAVNQSGLNLAQSLLATGISEQLEKRSQLFGLNRFSIDPLIVGRGNDPTARVTLGRRVTKDLSITYSQNLTSSGQSGIDRIVLVEYRLSNKLSVVGYRNERGALGFDVRIRKRF